jgi:hypothetical protein
MRCCHSTKISGDVEDLFAKRVIAPHFPRAIEIVPKAGFGVGPAGNRHPPPGRRANGARSRHDRLSTAANGTGSARRLIACFSVL